MVAINVNTTADACFCEQAYNQIRKQERIGGRSNYLTFPSAKKYVQQLQKDLSLNSVEKLQHKLAVVTGVKQGSAGFYVAEELASAAQMDVIVVGHEDVSEIRLAAALVTEESRNRRSRKRDRAPRIFSLTMNPCSLRSVSDVAQQIERIAHDQYQGQIHLLVNFGSQVHDTYTVTEEGVDINIGHNYLAPRLLTDHLLPQLRAAASNDYTPRIIQESTVGHCRGGDFHPLWFRRFPREGGARDGTLVPKEESEGVKYASPEAALEMYYRSKMALMADGMALAKEEPMLAVVSCDPGFLNYAASSSSNSNNNTAALGPYAVNVSPSQGARSALRAALDPVFDSTTETMKYLNCDANPWVVAHPTMVRKGSVSLDEYADMVRNVGDEMLGQLLADQDCQVDRCCLPSSPATKNATTSMDASLHSNGSSHGLGLSSSSWGSSSSRSLSYGGSNHSSSYSHDFGSYHDSMLGLSYSSLL